MDVDLFCLGSILVGTFAAGMVAGASLVVSPPAEPGFAAETTNFVDRHWEPKLLDWLPGTNQRERLLYRLNTTRAFRFSDYTGSQHILSDPQWRRARAELLQAGYIEIIPGKGRTGTLSDKGSVWLERQLYGNKQTRPTNTARVGEGGDPVPVPVLPAGFHPIDRSKMYK